MRLNESCSMHFFVIASAASHYPEIGASDFASYRDERLKAIKASTLKRELAPLHNMFELAREESCLPFCENPLRKVRVTSVQGRRERRIKNGELH